MKFQFGKDDSEEMCSQKNLTKRRETKEIFEKDNGCFEIQTYRRFSFVDNAFCLVFMGVWSSRGAQFY
jgi:hypothetical protein